MPDDRLEEQRLERIHRDRATRARAFTVESVRHLVETFYGSVREDPELGPIFDGVIEAGIGWPAHLDKMTRFWCALLMHRPGYDGEPRAAHARVPGLRPEHFDRWLELWRRDVRSVFDEEPARYVIERAEHMDANFRRALFG